MYYGIALPMLKVFGAHIPLILPLFNSHIPLAKVLTEKKKLKKLKLNF